MTTRNDVTVDYIPSPRVAEVASPSLQINMQDLVDTLRIDEEGFSRGLSYPKLLDATGKQPLGGGVSVGITVALQNLLLAFEPRTTPAETGTVTTGSGAPIAGEISFTDTAADFDAAGVKRGSLVINFTDHSIADVVSVDGTDTLTTKVLVNGIDNTFEIGDVYHVFNIIQCQVEGGNLTAVDDAQSDIDPILPTAFTQVVRTSSSSATLQEQADIQYASFNGGVWVDLDDGTPGTIFPTGTQRQPVNNFTNALSIANTRGFLTMYMLGSAIIDDSNDFTDFKFFGQGQNLTTLTLDPDATFVNASFVDATVTGTLDGDSHIEDCVIEDLNFVSGVITRCLFNPGTITLGGSKTAHFINCASGVPGLAMPIIDLGGSGQPLALRNYNGGIKLVNKSGTESVSVDLNSGQIVLGSTVTNGTIVARGVGRLVDEAGDDIVTGAWNGATIVNELISNPQIVNELRETPFDGVEFKELMWCVQSWGFGNFEEISPGVFDYYRADGTTKLMQMTVEEDAEGLVTRTTTSY